MSACVYAMKLKKINQPKNKGKLIHLPLKWEVISTLLQLIQLNQQLVENSPTHCHTKR